MAGGIYNETYFKNYPEEKDRDGVLYGIVLVNQKNMGTRNYKSRHRKRKNIQRRSQKRAWVYKLRHQNTKDLDGNDLRLLEMGTETTYSVPD